MEAGAQIYGWINAHFSRKGINRQPNEARAMNSTVALLRDQMSPDLLAQHSTESARLSEDGVCKIAVR